ncbi:nitrophenyl compound nitroreductase subunit ArsF family protein [Planctomycetota bacterium]
MTKEAGINILKRSLLAFVLVTIGFAIGKEVTLRRVQVGSPDTSKKTGPDQVAVSYAHATIRCVTCNTIERLVKETLDEQFTEAMTQQRVTFTEVDFQENMAFAKQFKIVANCVVLRQIVQGTETKHQRLDKIWELYENPPAFKQYLGDAIRDYLDPLPEGNL